MLPEPGVKDEDVEDHTTSTNTEHTEHKFSHLKLRLWCSAHENSGTTMNYFISHSSFHGQCCSHGVQQQMINVEYDVRSWDNQIRQHC